MRRFRGNKRRFNAINITNITNITQVGAGHGHRPAGKRRGDIRERRTERQPKLLRFCGSCGMMDQDVASRMSSSELCDESVKVIGYASKGLCRSTERCVGHMSRGVAGITKGVFQIIGAFVKVFG